MQVEDKAQDYYKTFKIKLGVKYGKTISCATKAHILCENKLA